MRANKKDIRANQPAPATAPHNDDTDIPRAAQPAAFTPKTLIALQRTIGNRAVGRLIQRNRVEKYKSYDEAKNANKYAKALLDTQKNDTIEKHYKASFTDQERNAIYKVNTIYSIDGKIHSDSTGALLHLQDTSVTPHIDHRYPKAKGGSNSFKNAAVIPADKNIAKSDKTDLDGEPTTALDPYKGLKDDEFSVLKHSNFTGPQKDQIYKANRAYYKAKLDKIANSSAVISDHDQKTVLMGYDSSQVPHIDHLTSRSTGGTSFFFNAQVESAEDNIEKSGAKGVDTEAQYDAMELEMTLPEYYDYVASGREELPPRLKKLGEVETKYSKKVSKRELKSLGIQDDEPKKSKAEKSKAEKEVDPKKLKTEKEVDPKINEDDD